MTPDEVMAIANQTAGHHWMDEAHIQRFADKVAAYAAAHEREECARECDELEWEYWRPRHCAAAIRARK